MKFPATSDELRHAGYEYSNDSRCQGPDCDATIEWWITPNGRRMPFSVRKAGNLLFQSAEVREPHWASCPNAPNFRKPKGETKP